MSVPTLLALITGVALLFVTAFFWRGRKDRIMLPLCIFFALNGGIYLSFFATEFFGQIAISNPEYLRIRGLAFRGALASIGVWLAWALWHK